jgi:hypothetical protein
VERACRATIWRARTAPTSSAIRGPVRTRRSGSPNRRPGSLAPRRPRRRPLTTLCCRGQIRTCSPRCSIAWPRPTLAQPSRNRRAELQHPTPHRFIGDVEPALGEQFLHVAVAQRKAEIEPDRVLADLGRKTMAAERSHAATLTLRAALARPVSVTKPPEIVGSSGVSHVPSTRRSFTLDVRRSSAVR